MRIETLFSDHESASPVTPRGHCISTSCTALYFKSSRSLVSHRSHYMIGTWHVGWAIVDLRDPHHRPMIEVCVPTEPWEPLYERLVDLDNSCHSESSVSPGSHFTSTSYRTQHFVSSVSPVSNRSQKKRNRGFHPCLGLFTWRGGLERHAQIQGNMY